MRLFLVLTILMGSTGWTKNIENLLKEEKGFLLCQGGGTQAPLFSKDCEKLTLYRIDQGSIKYEGTCLDSNGTTYLLACDAISFEFNRKLEIKDKSYWKQN